MHSSFWAPKLFHRQIFKSQSHLRNTFLVFRMFCIPTHQRSDEFSITDTQALQVQNLLKHNGNKTDDEIEQALNQSKLFLNEDLVLNVLRRHRSDWKPAYTFFNWVKKNRGCSVGSCSYNEILDILGRMKRFPELTQLLDEMSEGKIVFEERTYAIVVNRYAAAHKVEEATRFFYRRREFGLELDSMAFQTLLLSLCRYKHVEAAEVLFLTKKDEFGHGIKTMNIILDGWRVLGSLRETKRFWKDIIASRYKPDKFTYGIFINSLTKAGKISTAVKLFRGMWATGAPDVTICNCVIDGLCFKKRIPEALEIFHEMVQRNCHPNVATYNSLIKHLCKIQRMEKVYELLDEMEQKGESCSPNAVTYCYLLNAAKKPEDVFEIMERMEKNGCKMTADTSNLMLRLYMGWDLEQNVKSTWLEMKKSGLGPDQRSYTIMIHGLFDKGRMKEALSFFDEMTMKGMVPEPRTKSLVSAINIELIGRAREPGNVGEMSRERGTRRLRRGR